MSKTQGLREIDLTKIGLTNVRSGKVRTVGEKGNSFVAVTTHRLSAFNVVSSQTVPFKAESLNAQSNYFLRESQGIIGSWIVANPHPMVSIGKKLAVFPYEFIYRAVLMGSLADDYAAGSRGQVYGINLPSGLRKNQFFEEPIFTPTRKSENDEKISFLEILDEGVVRTDILQKTVEYGYALFDRMSALSLSKGLILADCKLEFGLDADGHIQIADEAPTGDSARFFDKTEFEKSVAAGKEPKQLSKEYLRQLLKEKGWKGETPNMPIFSDEEIVEAGARYSNLTQRLTGNKPQRINYSENLEKEILEIIFESLRAI
jgi:phosphoribosylaminoimidazole-succinocarboxamide synthase